MRRYTIAIDGRQFVVDVEDTAADRFRVVVDGGSYEVALGTAEEVGSTSTPPVAVRAVPVAAAPADGGGVLRAPMPGTILRVAVAAGARVVRGQDIAVLEAMKMENVLRAAQPGVVAEVCVQPGRQVAHGDPIVRFETGG